MAATTGNHHGPHPGPLVHPPTRRVYWPCLKNAHTSMNKWLVDYKPVSPTCLRQTNQHSGQHWAIIRDPYERYLSALHTIWAVKHATAIDWEDYVTHVAHWNSQQPHIHTAGNNNHHAPQHTTRHPEALLWPMHHLDQLAHWLNLDPPPHRNPAELEHIEYARQRIPEQPIRRNYETDQNVWDNTIRTWEPPSQN